MTFGEIIAQKRRELGLSQKDVAARVKKEDGEAISPQYLNDLERNRRNPPSAPLLRQFAELLGLSEEYLSFVAGRLPEDLRADTYQPEQVDEAFRVFRRTLKEGRQ